MKNGAWLASVLFVIPVLSAIGLGDTTVSISSSGASYFWDPADRQIAVFDHQSGAITDALFEDAFFFRYDDSTNPFGTETYVVELTDATDGKCRYQGTTNNGDNAVSTWYIVGGLQITHLYTITMTQTISTDGDCAVVDYQFDITNVEGDAASDFDLFQFVDYDIEPFGTNSATAGFDKSDVVIDMTGDEADAKLTGIGSTRFELREVGNGPRITSDILATNTYDLDDDPTTLTDVDINAAIQWDGIMPAIGNTETLFSQAKVFPRPSVVLADAVNVLLGTHASGDVSDMDESDDSYLCTERGHPFAPNFPSIILEIEGTLPTDSPSSLSVYLESHVTDIGIDQEIFMYNFDTAQYESVDVRDATFNVDSVADIALTGDVTRFVEAGTGAVRTKIHYTEDGSGFFATWQACFDQFHWNLQ